MFQTFHTPTPPSAAAAPTSTSNDRYRIVNTEDLDPHNHDKPTDSNINDSSLHIHTDNDTTANNGLLAHNETSSSLSLFGTIHSLCCQSSVRIVTCITASCLSSCTLILLLLSLYYYYTYHYPYHNVWWSNHHMDDTDIVTPASPPIMCSTYTPLYQSINTSLSFYSYDFTYQRILSAALKCSIHQYSACVSVQIHNGQIYVISYQSGAQTRQQSTLMLFYRLQELYGHLLPNTILTVGSGDGDLIHNLNSDVTSGIQYPVFQYARHSHVPALLIPDFNWIAWPEAEGHTHHQVLNDIIRVRDSTPFHKKSKKLFARFAKLGQQRADLLDVALHHTDTMDIKYIWFRDDPNRFSEDATHGAIITLADHCRYKYLAVPDGAAYIGRLKYLLYCNSVLLKPKTTYWEFWTHLLRPDETYIEYQEDASDADAIIRSLWHNESKAQRIADAAVKLATKYLSFNAVDCYMMKLLHSYSETCKDCSSVHSTVMPHAIPIERYIVEHMSQQPHSMSDAPQDSNIDEVVKDMIHKGR